VQNPALRSDMGYDPLKDFTPIGLVVTYPGVIFVAPSLPVRTVKELVAYAQANPGKLNYGSGGTGSADHLATEAFMSMTGTKMVHVPYKSTADVIRETIAGNVQLSISPLTTVLQHVKAGQLRAIAVTTVQRVHALPDVPALGEIDIKGLPDLDPLTYLALVGPAGLPPAVVARLNDAINKVSAMPDFAARLRDEYGSTAATSTPDGFREHIRKDIERWKAIGKTVKLPD
jgi:tripartite-type tricarboxylate transporter receptor subunit TctC